MVVTGWTHSDCSSSTFVPPNSSTSFSSRSAYSRPSLDTFTSDLDDNCDMTGAQRSKPSRVSNLAGNPPRPANAWILYRSEKMKQIPPINPGDPPRPQADVSKAISQMWRNEPPEVRAIYERESMIKKAEHQEKYPNYRFQPLKKEDKEKIREERRLERERAKEAKQIAKRTRSVSGSSSTAQHSPASASSRVNTSWATALAPYLNVRDQQAGPSTPVTPRKSSNGHPPHFFPPTPLSSSSTDGPSDSSDAPSAQHSPKSLYPPSPETRAVPSLGQPTPGVVASLSQTPTHWYADTDSLVQEAIQRYEASLPKTKQENSFNQFEYLIGTSNLNLPDDLLSWNVLGDDAGLTASNPTSYDASLAWNLNGDPESFDFGDFDAYVNTDLSGVTGGEPLQIDFSEPDFSNFLADFSLSPSSSASQTQNYPTALTNTHPSDDYSGYYGMAPFASHDAHHASDTNGTSYSSLSPSSVRTSSHDFGNSAMQLHATNNGTTYTPPSGAANASSRRVGADWRHSLPTSRIPSS